MTGTGGSKKSSTAPTKSPSKAFLALVTKSVKNSHASQFVRAFKVESAEAALKVIERYEKNDIHVLFFQWDGSKTKSLTVAQTNELYTLVSDKSGKRSRIEGLRFLFSESL